jgi:hypothetical protein
MNDIDIKLYLIGNEPYDEQQTTNVCTIWIGESCIKQQEHNLLYFKLDTSLIQKLVHNLVAPHSFPVRFRLISMPFIDVVDG